MQNSVLLLAEYVGIASAALSGFLFAVKRRCDLLGIFIASFLTALGGGLMRDCILSRPPYSFTNYMPLSIVLVVIILASVTKIYKKVDFEHNFWFVFTDAIDLVSFSIVGSIVSIEYNMNIYGAVIIGFLNGAGGGMLRDITFSEVPWFFKTGLYGTISMVVSLICFVIFHTGFYNVFTIIFMLVFGVAFRLLAYYNEWHLPILNKDK